MSRGPVFGIVVGREIIIYMVRKKKKEKKEKKELYTRSRVRFRRGRIERVLSERIVFGDIDKNAEIDMDVEVDLHGMTRGGRGRM